MNERIKLAEKDGIPVCMHDVWKTTAYDKACIFGVYPDNENILCVHDGSTLGPVWVSELTHPTRFNGLDLDWREGWTYPVAEIDNDGDPTECVIELEGMTKSLFFWPFGTSQNDSGIFGCCPVSDWCPTCHKPKSACTCKEKVDAIDLDTGKLYRKENGVYVDHSPDATKKLGDSTRYLNLANSLEKLADLNLKTAERVTAITDRETKTSQKVAALRGSVQALISRIKALEVTQDTTTE